MASRPSGDLLAEPPEVAYPKVVVDPATGKEALDGAAALPWALDTLGVVGALRSTVQRWQSWYRETHAEPAPAD